MICEVKRNEQLLTKSPSHPPSPHLVPWRHPNKTLCEQLSFTGSI